MIETSSDLLRSSSAILGNLRKMFGKYSELFVSPTEQFLKSSESGRTSSENRQKRRHQHVYIIKIGTQCVHVSAIWKFNDHVGKKAMQASRTKDICVLSP